MTSAARQLEERVKTVPRSVLDARNRLKPARGSRQRQMTWRSTVPPKKKPVRPPKRATFRTRSVMNMDSTRSNQTARCHSDHRSATAW